MLIKTGHNGEKKRKGGGREANYELLKCFREKNIKLSLLYVLILRAIYQNDTMGSTDKMHQFCNIFGRL